MYVYFFYCNIVGRFVYPEYHKADLNANLSQGSTLLLLAHIHQIIFTWDKNYYITMLAVKIMLHIHTFISPLL